MKNIAILCDSSADLSVDEANELGIHVLRMPVIIDGVEYKEAITITTAQIIDKLKANAKVTTTQPSLGEFKQCWDELLETYDQILYLPLSKNLSGTNAAAMQLAQEYDGKVVVIDSTFVCQPVVTMLKWAKDMIAKGYSAQQIKEMFEQQGELYALLIPETLTTLKNGGRISPAAAALGGLLKIQPILKVENGAIDVYDKVRTLKKAYKVAAEAITKVDDASDYAWMVIHTNNLKAAQEIKEQLEATLHQPVEIKEFNAVIVAHTGDGTIGIGRIKKIKY